MRKLDELGRERFLAIRRYCRDNADYSMLPDHDREGMRRYLVEGVQTGDFLVAVIENDLQQAVRRADLSNLSCLRDIVNFMDSIPPVCWGSKTKRLDWIQAHSEFRQEDP